MASASSGRLARFAQGYGQEIVVAAAILVLFGVVDAVNPRFLAPVNLNTIFAGNAYIAVAAIGMSLVIICGHIDVSVGSLIGVLAVVAGTLAVDGYPVWVAWGVPVVAGVLCNAAMGALIAYSKIPSIVVTLGMMSILRGGLISITGGTWITNMPSAFFIAQMRLFGVPVPVYFMVVLTLITAFWMRSFTAARAIYAVGGNAEAARTTGFSPERTCIFVFALHGFFAGIAALLFATQLQVIQSTVPANLELTVITASVIGGVSILGGTGTVIGSTLAAILFGTISSSLIFLNVSAYWLRAVLGLMILATVLVDMARRRRSA